MDYEKNLLDNLSFFFFHYIHNKQLKDLIKETQNLQIDFSNSFD